MRYQVPGPGRARARPRHGPGGAAAHRGGAPVGPQQRLGTGGAAPGAARRRRRRRAGEGRLSLQPEARGPRSGRRARGRGDRGDEPGVRPQDEAAAPARRHAARAAERPALAAGQRGAEDRQGVPQHPDPGGGLLPAGGHPLRRLPARDDHRRQRHRARGSVGLPRGARLGLPPLRRARGQRRRPVRGVPAVADARAAVAGSEQGWRSTTWSTGSNRAGRPRATSGCDAARRWATTSPRGATSSSGWCRATRAPASSRR